MTVQHKGPRWGGGGSAVKYMCSGRPRDRTRGGTTYGHWPAYTNGQSTRTVVGQGTRDGTTQGPWWRDARWYHLRTVADPEMGSCGITTHVFERLTLINEIVLVRNGALELSLVFTHFKSYKEQFKIGTAVKRKQKFL